MPTIRESRRYSLRSVKVLAVVLPLVYVVSFGPMCRLALLNVVPFSWLRTIYLPLRVAREHTPLKYPLEWYVKICTEDVSDPLRSGSGTQ